MCVSRIGAIFSGVFCLLQGIVWLALYAVGLLAFKCSFKAPNEDIQLFLDIYFNHGHCDEGADSINNILSNILGPEFGNNQNFIIATPPGFPFTPPTTDLPRWPRSVPASNRTELLLVLYVTLTVAWIFSSVMLTIGASIESKGPKAALFYLPWIIITSVICVMDVISTILYATDIPKTTTILDLLKFIGVYTGGLDAGSITTLSQSQVITMVPAIVMTVVSAKCVLLWLFNFILLLVTTLALRNNIENYNSKKNTRNEGDWRNVSQLWLTQPPRKDSTESVPPDGAGSNPWQMRPRDLSSIDRMHDNNNRANANEMDYTFHNFLRAEGGDRSSFRDNGPPPAEVRNGLPWSYFSHRDDLKGPPKRNKNVLEPMPPVPPPDYTLKFPQYTRPVINRNAEHRSSWSSKDGNPATPEPFIPAPDYEKKRLPPRIIGRQSSQESNNSQVQQRYGTREPPHIPHPDYDIRGVPSNAMKPTMKQELQAMVAARGRTNPGYISTENDGYTQPHVPLPDYAKPRKVDSRVEGFGNRPRDDLANNQQHNISGVHHPNRVAGRARHYGYF